MVESNMDKDEFKVVTGRALWKELGIEYFDLQKKGAYQVSKLQKNLVKILKEERKSLNV